MRDLDGYEKNVRTRYTKLVYAIAQLPDCQEKRDIIDAAGLFHGGVVDLLNAMSIVLVELRSSARMITRKHVS